MPEPLVSCFQIGPQKAGTTWIYRCLAEHPEVAMPPSDSIHFFDMHYHRGLDWYHEFFDGAVAARHRLDPTPTYLRSSWAPRRIVDYNPHAKIMVCLRHPVDRAFSHYWHGKKKFDHDLSFEKVLSNYDVFATWLEPGLYAEHLERYFEIFPRQQVLCQRFDKLQSAPAQFLDELWTFLGVRRDVRPSILDRKVNVAGPRQTLHHRMLYHAAGKLRWFGLQRLPDRVRESGGLGGKGEYVSGIDPALYDRLMEVCLPEIERLERLLGEDFSDWKASGRAMAPAHREGS